MQEAILEYNFLVWLLFGLVVGLIAHLLDPGDVRGGIFATLGFGILGSIAGGVLASLLFVDLSSGISTFHVVTAVISAAVLAIVYRYFFRNKNHIKTLKMRIK